MSLKTAHARGASLGAARLKASLAIVAVLAIASVTFLTWAFDAEPSTPVRLEAPAYRDIRPSVFASGQFVHGDSVRIASEVVGRVTAVHVEEGQPVRKGDLLLEIDAAAYDARVAEQEAAVRVHEADIARRQLAVDRLAKQHERAQRLHQAQMQGDDAYERIVHEWRLAEVDLLTGQEALKQAMAALAQAQDLKSKTQVFAPLDGVVSSLEIEVGESAIVGTTNTPGSILLEVANPTSILAEVHVDEADVAGIRAGQHATVVPAAYPKSTLPGVVAFVATSAKYRPNGRSRSFRVRIALLETGGLELQLRAGMSCRADVYLATDVRPTATVDRAAHPAHVGDVVDLARESSELLVDDAGALAPSEVLSVPLAALVTREIPGADEVEHFVFAVTGARLGRDVAWAADEAWPVRRVDVELGVADDEFQEVRNGISADDLVVSGPSKTLRTLRDGDRVSAME